MRSLLISAILLLAGSYTASAQETTVFGDNSQPGTRLHQQIMADVELGNDQQTAIAESIESALQEESTILSPAAKSAVGLNIPMADGFYVQMLAVNSLIEVVKIMIEENSNEAPQIVALGTYLYPDFAQEVIDGAVLTGVISGDDALLIALASGADPTSVSTATAATGAPAPTAPIGAGIGGGGAGGGDTTASTN